MMIETWMPHVGDKETPQGRAIKVFAQGCANMFEATESQTPFQRHCTQFYNLHQHHSDQIELLPAGGICFADFDFGTNGGPWLFIDRRSDRHRDLQQKHCCRARPGQIMENE